MGCRLQSSTITTHNTIQAPNAIPSQHARQRRLKRKTITSCNTMQITIPHHYNTQRRLQPSTTTTHIATRIPIQHHNNTHRIAFHNAIPLQDATQCISQCDTMKKHKTTQITTQHHYYTAQSTTHFHHKT